jgi:hypothetical protein
MHAHLQAHLQNIAARGQVSAKVAQKVADAHAAHFGSVHDPHEKTLKYGVHQAVDFVAEIMNYAGIPINSSMIKKKLKLPAQEAKMTSVRAYSRVRKGHVEHVGSYTNRHGVDLLNVRPGDYVSGPRRVDEHYPSPAQFRIHNVAGDGTDMLMDVERMDNESGHRGERSVLRAADIVSHRKGGSFKVFGLKPPSKVFVRARLRHEFRSGHVTRSDVATLRAALKHATA